MKQRVGLWGALAVLTVGAVVAVVTVGAGRDGGGASPLPLALGGGGDQAATAAAGDTMEIAPVAVGVYVPGDGLPSLGGSAPAYRLPSAVDEAAVRRLAGALGVDGDPVEQRGAWHVGGDELVLDVYAPGGTWSAYRTSADAAAPADDRSSAAGGGISGSPGEVAPGSAPAGGEAEEPPDERCPTDAATQCLSERPADLPSEDEARGIALDLLAATGTDVEDAEVRVDDAVTQWAVTLEPRLGDRPAPGLAAFVAVGAGGRVEAASGSLPQPERLGDYPLLDTGATLDRLNDGGWPGAASPHTVTESATASGSASGAAHPGPVPGPTRTGPEAAPGGQSAGSGAAEAAPDDVATTIRPDAAVACGAASGPDPTTTTTCDANAPAPAPQPAPACRPAPADGGTDTSTLECTLACPTAPGGDPGADIPEGAETGRCVADPACPDGSEPGPGADTLECPPGCPTAPARDADAETAGCVPDPACPDGREPGLDSDADTGGCVPGPTVPEPEPVEVTVTDAEVVLVSVPSWDGSGTYLVPGYRFTAEDGSAPTVPAVTDDMLAPPDGQREPGALPEDQPAVTATVVTPE